MKRIFFFETIHVSICYTQCVRICRFIYSCECDLRWQKKVPEWKSVAQTCQTVAETEWEAACFPLVPASKAWIPLSVYQVPGSEQAAASLSCPCCSADDPAPRLTLIVLPRNKQNCLLLPNLITNPYYRAGFRKSRAMSLLFFSSRTNRNSSKARARVQAETTRASKH